MKNKSIAEAGCCDGIIEGSVETFQPGRIAAALKKEWKKGLGLLVYYK